MHTLNAFLVCQDGQPWLVGGTPGGDQQTQWSTQVITSIVDHGLSPQEAVEAPRWFSFPGTDPAIKLSVLERLLTEHEAAMEAKMDVLLGEFFA